MFVNSCVFIETRIQPLSVSDLRQSSNYRIAKPVKVHLQDGSMVLYNAGFKVEADTIRTIGIKYEHNQIKGSRVPSLPVTEIVYLEAYYQGIAAGPSILVTAGILLLLFVTIYAAGMSAMSSMGA